MHAILKSGLVIASILLLSACSTFIGESPEDIQAYQQEKVKNTELKTEARALREAIEQNKKELEEMQ